MALIYLTAGTPLKNFRKEQYDIQGGICPILKQKIPFEDMVVDHQHMTKAETLGVDGAGLVRGIIHNGANAAEGTMLAIYKRRGLKKFISFPDYLRSLADYTENPPLINLGYVHPNEKPKRLEFGRREFNRVLKYWSQMYPKKKKPVWKSKMKRSRPTGKMNLTKDFTKWIKEADDLHYAKYK